MERMIDVIETTIPKGRTLRIQDGKDLELRVIEGSLWVTQEHDTDDIVLDATDTFRVNRDGLTLAHACKEVRLQIANSTGAGAPSVTLGGGYREFGSSVVSAMFAGWMREARGWIATGVGQRTGRLGMNVH